MLHVGCASTPKTPPANPPTSANVGQTTIVAIAPQQAAECSTTLPKFLGLPGLAKGVGGVLHRIGSRLLNGLDLTGRFPGLQPQPPVLPLTDPANLEPDAPPAVQAAAEIKAEEDAAPQKVMAIRYLATLGCGGCYEKVEDALLEGLNDCTEEVRYEAARALQCKPECGCKFCSSPTCCSAKVRKKLEELTLCDKEPSARVRRVARLSLACCSSKPFTEEAIPREGPPGQNGSEQKSLLTDSVAESNLFDGMQLFYFESMLAPASTGDMVLANVNGEPIYESQVLPILERNIGSDVARSQALQQPAERRKALAQSLYRAIDWKIVEHAAKQEVSQASASSSSAPFSPEELQMWFSKRSQVDPWVTPEQVAAYYAIHRQKYIQPARIRWEKLAVDMERSGSREKANAIATFLRNKAMGGKSEPPPGFSREMVSNQTFDWTEFGMVFPENVRKALQSMQVGQMSLPMEIDNQLCIVRVLERENESMIPLPNVAQQIQAEILSQRKRDAEARTLGQLRMQSQVWTVFDNPTGK